MLRVCAVKKQEENNIEYKSGVAHRAKIAIFNGLQNSTQYAYQKKTYAYEKDLCIHANPCIFKLPNAFNQFSLLTSNDDQIQKKHRPIKGTNFFLFGG